MNAKWGECHKFYVNMFLKEGSTTERNKTIIQGVSGS